MSNDSSENPYSSPAQVNESNPSTPGVLGITGAFVIAALAGGGACCASCFGGIFLLDGIMLGGGGALAICALIGLITFGVVLSVLTRTLDALNSKTMTTTNDAINPPANSSHEHDTDDAAR